MSHKVTKFDYNQTDRTGRIWFVIESHRPESETFALKYGGLIIALPTLVSSFYCQNYFNKRFKLGRVLYTYVPMLIPGIGSGLMHRKLIEEEVLHENMACTGCTELKLAAVHFVSGTFWSFLLSSFSGCMLGSLKKTIYVPPIEKYPFETIKFVGKHFSKFGAKAVALSLGNFAFTLALTSLEIKQYENLKLRLLVRLSNFESQVTPAEFGEYSSDL